MLKRPPATQEEVVERAALIFGIVGSKGLHDEEHIREMARRSWERAPRPARARAASSARSSRAATGPRSCVRSGVPTLVIHGTRDKLVRPSGGKATAKAIPGAKLMKVEGMGHDLPRPLWPTLIDAIAATPSRRTDGQVSEPAGAAAASP